MHTYVHTPIHNYTPACVLMHTHTHKHTYTHLDLDRTPEGDILVPDGRLSKNN